MTRPVDRSKAANYLRKAEGSLNMAKIALKETEYDNAIMSAVHAGINALDALTTSYFGKKASGEHADAISLSKGIFTIAEYRDVQKQFTSLLSLKNASEYQPELMSLDQAKKAVTWVERIVHEVEEKLDLSR